DLGDLTQQLMKMTVEAALGAELDDHLRYNKHDPAGGGSGNNRNGTSSKRLKGQHGEVEIDEPRDRAGTFEPQIVRKGQTRLTQMDDQILALYAKGMSTRDIVDAFREMYDADVSPTLVSKVTERVLDAVTEWQNRGLQDILIACVDGLKGFPDAIAAEYPQTRVQLCIVQHVVRNSLKYVSWKDYKAVTTALKEVCQERAHRRGSAACSGAFCRVVGQAVPA